ncbi:hypothetical protein GCM10007390_17430 [Persicitalea jodogahamensis]|uniref:DUF4145 domain-containing protein n=1 Tax=Persicitalea jodogahamensis TaxID=402147 RepID=A0A8J3G9J9_9BACT|nr:hypothetical protein GCM10007390_17430 [Persicitalea jodogahamensis]
MIVCEYATTCHDIPNVEEYLYQNPSVYFYLPFKKQPEELTPYLQVAEQRPFYKSFLKIYSQSYSAENYKLFEIAGMGFRKALEFLLKDYAIYLMPEQEEAIIKAALGNVININLKNFPTLVELAKRATWLGNDETHYLRRWEDKDISDLKRLIILTAHTIEQTEMIKQYLDEMPAPK